MSFSSFMAGYFFATAVIIAVPLLAPSDKDQTNAPPRVDCPVHFDADWLRQHYRAGPAPVAEEAGDLASQEGIPDLAPAEPDEAPRRARTHRY